MIQVGILMMMPVIIYLLANRLVSPLLFNQLFSVDIVIYFYG